MRCRSSSNTSSWLYLKHFTRRSCEARNAAPSKSRCLTRKTAADRNKPVGRSGEFSWIIKVKPLPTSQANKWRFESKNNSKSKRSKNKSKSKRSKNKSKSKRSKSKRSKSKSKRSKSKRLKKTKKNQMWSFLSMHFIPTSLLSPSLIHTRSSFGEPVLGW